MRKIKQHIYISNKIPPRRESKSNLILNKSFAILAKFTCSGFATCSNFFCAINCCNKILCCLSLKIRFDCNYEKRYQKRSGSVHTRIHMHFAVIMTTQLRPLYLNYNSHNGIIGLFSSQKLSQSSIEAFSSNKEDDTPLRGSSYVTIFALYFLDTILIV